MPVGARLCPSEEVPVVKAVKVLSAVAFDAAHFEETGRADPAVRVLAELPAKTEPFHVNRVYKGAHGRYEEVLAIADPSGTVVWESEPRLIQLRGEMYEDLFRLRVDASIQIADAGEHALLLYLDGQLVARVPLFVDAPRSLIASGATMDAVETALKKGSIVWLNIPQRGGDVVQRPAWYVQEGRSIYVIKGGREQELPGLESVEKVTVVVKSKDINATIAELPAGVRVVTDDAEFERVATLGMGTRLNLLDGQGALERWRNECVMVHLTPLG
jgi:hypothetical protein